MVDATKRALERLPVTAKRGRLSERAWADVRRAARLAREEGVTLRVHGIEVTGELKQRIGKPKKPRKVQQQPAETVEPERPSTAGDVSSAAVESPPLPISKRKERSAQRLLEFQKKKRAEIFATKYGKHVARHEVLFQLRGHHPLLARAKLRWLLWRAWAQYRPIFGGAVLRYTSLREQYVYKRAAQLYNAAFKSDPGKSVRTLAAWLRHATPMETDASSSGSQPSKRAKKSRGNRARALPVAHCERVVGGSTGRRE